MRDRLGRIAVLLLVASMLASLLFAPSASAATADEVDVRQTCSTVDIVEVRITGEGSRLRVSILPTDRARHTARFDVESTWRQLWSCTPMPPALSASQQASLHDQLRCHAYFSARMPGSGEWNTGPTWDLESWRPDVSEARLLQVWDHRCNWTS